MTFFTKSMLEESDYEAKQYAELSIGKSVEDYESFDIFLSHSYRDKKYIRKLKDYIESNFKIRCYVDWLCEPNVLNRDKITRDSAEILRKRMRQSKNLIFCTSDNSSYSRWMPWELGYFDGYRKGHVAILPIMNEEESFEGQEYLGLYPYIDKGGMLAWVNGIEGGGYMNLKDWLSK